MPHTPKMTPFYQSALDAFTATQKEQINKGAQKYPEPFNPLSWSPDALLQHAMEEAVDLVHYLTGLHQQIQAREQEIRRLNDIIADKDRNISTLIESQRHTARKPPYADLDD